MMASVGRRVVGACRRAMSTVMDDGAPLSRSGAGAIAVRLGLTAARSQPELGDAVPSADEWLAGLGRGAYTNARTLQRYSVVKWKDHKSRLESGAAAMLAKRGEDAEALLEDIKELDGPMLVAVRAGLLSHAQRFKNYDGELKLCLCVTGLSTEEPPTPPTLHIHVAPLGERAERPVIAMLQGGPRDDATAKDSKWVHERMRMEAAKPADVNELLLTIPGTTSILEGASSNFFAVLKDAPAVETADEGVLMGSMRAEMLAACEDLGVEVRARAPDAAEASARWSGALLTSTARLALPLDALRMRGRNEDVRFEQGGLAHALAERLEMRIAATAERVI